MTREEAIKGTIDAGTLQDNLTDIYGDGNRLVYLKDVLDLIDEQPTLKAPNEWVNVEDRLPKHLRSVLVCYDSGYIERVWYDEEMGEFYREYFYGMATHWMPLPAPPDRRAPEGGKDT